ncbi:MAG: hypothetical protein IJW50_02130 [Clostridia bacterium]|nr:hypothetical protein [Clostridia bacterium]
MDDINDRARDPASREPGAVLNEVLSNPALLQSIAAAIRGTGGSASTEDACAETVATPLQEGISEDGIAHVLSDPALMQKLPEVMATIAPLLAGREEENTPKKSDVPAMANMKEGHRRRTQRDDLLLALKPFLSPARCEAIDTLIRISRLGNALQNLK